MIFIGCLLVNLGILAVLKYTNFAIANVNGIAALFTGRHSIARVNLVLPLGISFYTFQTMGYVIDVYRGKAEAEKNIFKMALFTSFFPQLIQGPISRFGELSQTLYAPHRFDFRTVWFGLERVLVGLNFKKLVIADRIVVVVNRHWWDSRIFTADSTYFVACFFMRQNYMPTLPVALILQSVLRRCLAYSLPKTLNDRIFQKILRNTGADGTLPWERGLRIICFIRCLRPCRCCRCLHSAGNISARRQAGGFRCICNTGGMVCHGNLARCKLEFHCVGAVKCRSHSAFTGMSSAL